MLHAVKKDSEVIQEEGRAVVDGRHADDGQGPSEEVSLCLKLCTESWRVRSWYRPFWAGLHALLVSST